MIYRLYFRNYSTPLFSRRWDNTGSQKSIRVNVDVTSLPIYKSRHGLQRVLLYFSCISVSAWIFCKSLKNYTREITTEFFWALQVQSFMQVCHFLFTALVSMLDFLFDVYVVYILIRWLMVSTNQADPICFYFRISLILMERR